MSEQDLQESVLFLIRLAGILVIIFNLGIDLILFRQVLTMNNIVRVKAGALMIFIILIQMIVSGFLLMFVVFV